MVKFLALLRGSLQIYRQETQSETFFECHPRKGFYHHWVLKGQNDGGKGKASMNTISVILRRLFLCSWYMVVWGCSNWGEFLVEWESSFMSGKLNPTDHLNWILQAIHGFSLHLFLGGYKCLVSRIGEQWSKRGAAPRDPLRDDRGMMSWDKQVSLAWIVPKVG